MPYNLLLLPLLGGYWLLWQSNRTRYLFARQDGHRLLIWSAMAGAALLVVASMIVTVLRLLQGIGEPSSSGTFDLAAWWHMVSPFPHSGKAVGALVLGLLAPLLLNRLPAYRNGSVWARRAAEHYGQEIELLILRSLDHKMPLMATLGNGKVYVGYVSHAVNAETDRRYVRMLPMVSGYRDPSDQRVVFTMLYEDVMRQSDDPASPMYGVLQRDFEVVFPLSEVRSMNLFDWNVYEAFNTSPAA